MRVHLGADHAGFELKNHLVEYLTRAGHDVVDHGPASYDPAQLARRHNNANVVTIGARMHTMEQAVSYVDTFLSTPFLEDDRHARQIRMMTGYESAGVLPPLS